MTRIASAQLAGEDFMAGLDRQRADVAGQQITLVPGLNSTTAAGVARRITARQWQAVEAGPAAVTQRMMDVLPGQVTRAAQPRSRKMQVRFHSNYRLTSSLRQINWTLFLRFSLANCSRSDLDSLSNLPRSSPSNGR